MTFLFEGGHELHPCDWKSSTTAILLGLRFSETGGWSDGVDDWDVFELDERKGLRRAFILERKEENETNAQAWEKWKKMKWERTPDLENEM